MNGFTNWLSEIHKTDMAQPSEVTETAAWKLQMLTLCIRTLDIWWINPLHSASETPCHISLLNYFQVWTEKVVCGSWAIKKVGSEFIFICCRFNNNNGRLTRSTPVILLVLAPILVNFFECVQSYYLGLHITVSIWTLVWHEFIDFFMQIMFVLHLTDVCATDLV